MTRGEAVSRVDNDPLPACPHGPRPVIRSGIASLEVLDELKVIEIEVLEGTNALADGPVGPGHDRIVAPEIECGCEHRRVGMDGPVEPGHDKMGKHVFPRHDPGRGFRT